MAVTVVSKVSKKPDITRRHKRIRVTLTLTGTYVAGGFVVDFTQLTNPKMFEAAYAGSVPTDVEIINLPAGYAGQWNPNATPTLANGVLQLFSGANTEFTAGALTAALTAADAIELELQGPIGAF